MTADYWKLQTRQRPVLDSLGQHQPHRGPMLATFSVIAEIFSILTVFPKKNVEVHPVLAPSALSSPPSPMCPQTRS